MSEPPPIDGRDREKIRKETRALVPTYTPEWDLNSDGPGDTLLTLFAGLAADITERVDQLPAKHRISFFDSLGFQRDPPQAARIPLTFRVADGVDGTVTIPAGTQAVAAAEGGEEQSFEVAPGEGFEASPATLEQVFSADPRRDAIFEHAAVNVDVDGTTELFHGEDKQRHALYLSHDEALTLSPGASVEVVFGITGTSATFKTLEWEFYGTTLETDPETGDETESEPGWYKIESANWTPAEEGATETLTLKIPGMPTLTEESGVESRWLRCSVLPSEQTTRMSQTETRRYFNTVVKSVRLSVDRNNLGPDDAAYNDVPLEFTSGNSDDAPAQPLLGTIPRQYDRFYLASEEVFTKRGAKVTITFNGASVRVSEEVETPPRVVWEYWNGNGWHRIPGVDDSTNHLQFPNSNDSKVTFTVPDDLASTTEVGAENYWIRARLVDGAYVHVSYVPEGEGRPVKRETEGQAPTVNNIKLSYSQEREPTHLLTNNNLTYERVRPPFRPFYGLPTANQTLYLGFDRPLTDGPLALFFALGDAAYSSSFFPRIQWAYHDRSMPDGWTRLQVTDGTESLTESGIVRFSVPNEMVDATLFGHRLHWLRATVTGTRFDRIDEVTGGDDSISRSEAATGSAAAVPPVLHGVHPHTTWADNVRTVENETIGSSNGAPNQEFTFDLSPVTNETVWVDELPSTSAAERQTLAASSSTAVDQVTDTNGVLRAFWVRWQRVEDFFGSGSDDRHYTLDRITGRLAFGDGSHGRIPPQGRDNVRARYKTGGGVGGNVPANSVTDLVSSVAFVDSVTNPEPGDGGADAELMAEVLARAPETLRHRGRAVTAADFERIALDASRTLSRVKCIPGMDGTGDRRVGWMTLVVVPRARRPNPLPSPELRQRVFEAVRERAPAALVATDPPRLVVRGPTYVEVAVNTELVGEAVESVSALETRVEAELTQFLHWRSGGPHGEGWKFGELPRLSSLYAFLEGLEGIDNVESLSVTVTGPNGSVSVTEGGSLPSIGQDVLLSSGTHDVRVVETVPPAGVAGGDRWD